MKKTVVITTIGKDDNPIIRRIAEISNAENWDLIIVGDSKSPERFILNEGKYYSLSEQKVSGFRLGQSLPENHYCRKNIGYLEAIKNKSASIIDTDDDNIPEKGFGCSHVDNQNVVIDIPGWFNTFRYYYGGGAWPRGFPLDEILSDFTPQPRLAAEIEQNSVAVEQGMVRNEPDLDAIFRLTRTDRPQPSDHPAVILTNGVWAPFNSQNTIWHREAFPLLYLPATCTFRMTDIWRSFIAQRGLWNMGKTVLHHKATANQIRNDHNFITDFLSENVGYQHNKSIVQAIDRLGERSNDPLRYIREAYRLLISESFFSEDELALVDDWISDIAVAPDHY